MNAKSDSSAALTTDDHFHLGILVALGVVYAHDAETIAEEIVDACGAKELLRLAKQEEDPCLPHLRKTVFCVRKSHPRLARNTGR